MPSLSRDELICESLWVQGRRHGWSRDMLTKDLVADTGASDESWARDVCRDELPKFDSVRYHPGHDTFSLDVPHADLIKHLKEHCDGYSDLRSEATFKSR